MKKHSKHLVIYHLFFFLMGAVVFLYALPLKDVVLPDGNFPEGCFENYLENHSTSDQRIWKIGDICYTKLYIGTSGTPGFFGNTNQYKYVEWEVLQ